ncbi:GTPase [bacterium]|nr:MAG: GTPase [bacterium]
MGAAGRDFHNFNVVFRGDPRTTVVAFTATQIPDIAGRRYPAALAGPGYPDGIPIHPESDLVPLIRDLAVDRVVFAYSDVSHAHVMERAATALAAGADFSLLGPAATLLPSTRPVVAVTAARTGAGKSQTTRAVVAALRGRGRRVAVVRHPMPYGDLAAQAVQRFETYADLDAHHVTIEEREEYEPHLDAGSVVFAGVDYARILRAAEAEADVVVWDGGNNDLPFFRPDLHIVVLDPLRAGHERTYYPGSVNLRMADVAVINKVDSAAPDQLALLEASLAAVNPGATVVRAESRISVADPDAVRGKRVVVVEDGPTLTHGEMAFGAGHVAAVRLGAAEIVDPRPYAAGSIAATYAQYPTTGAVVPAMGYGERQIDDLETTLNRVPADLVLIGTPIDLARLVELNKPVLRVRYDLDVVGTPTLDAVIAERLGV